MAYLGVTDNTLSAIVTNVAQLVSFPTPADAAGDTDPAVVQMVQAVNVAGTELMAMGDWQELTKTHSISIQASPPGVAEQAFALPDDFYEFIDQTQWNSTMQWPAIGPVSPQAWQELLIRQTLPTLSFYWQVRGSELYIISPPTSPQTLKFYYQSLGWVRDADNASLYKNRAGRRPLRSRVAPIWRPSVNATAAGPSHGSIRAA